MVAVADRAGQIVITHQVVPAVHLEGPKMMAADPVGKEVLQQIMEPALAVEVLAVILATEVHKTTMAPEAEELEELIIMVIHQHMRCNVVVEQDYTVKEQVVPLMQLPYLNKGLD